MNIFSLITPDGIRHINVQEKRMEKAFIQTKESQQPELKTPMNSTRSESLGKLASALAQAQAQMEFAKKDSTNPHFKSKYADLASVIDAVRKPLASNGLSYVQYAESQGNDQYLVTQLMHSSGEWLSSRLKLILSKQDMQALGASLTYARRFGLSAMVGIAQDDDDGETAVGRPAQTQPVSTTPQKTQGVATESKPTEKQMNRLYAIAKSKQAKGDDITAYMVHHFKETDENNLTVNEYNQLCKSLEDGSYLNLPTPQGNNLPPFSFPDESQFQSEL
jgi:hypothetical protein